MMRLEMDRHRLLLIMRYKVPRGDRYEAACKDSLLRGIAAPFEAIITDSFEQCFYTAGRVRGRC